MSHDSSPRLRATRRGDRRDREREAENLRVYAEHRDPRLRERLIRQHLPLANSIARRFDHRKQVPLEDLKQTAAIGLIKALDRYDPANGATFSSFAVRLRR